MSEHVTALRILLVDDDAQVRRAYARVLRQAGFQVDLAEDGDDAIRQVQPGSYDVVVTDLTMPGLSGLALLRAIRERDLDIPVILVTGDPGFETAVDAVTHGAFRYLVKPVASDALIALVTQAGQVHRMAKLRREALHLLDRSGFATGDRASAEVHFGRALERLWMAFQPIVDRQNDRVYAYEALLRSDEPVLPSPGQIIDAAERLDRLHDLGRAVRRSVAETAPCTPDDALLFVNLHPRDLLDDDLYDPRSPLSCIARRVVLEVTERASLDGIGDVRSKIAALRALGYRVAIDDMGAGYAGLTSFAQVEPEVIKLDMSLIRDIDSTPTKRRLVESMVGLCRDMSILVVAEGVETASEYAALTEAGCNLLQGYFFARPSREFYDSAVASRRN